MNKAQEEALEDAIEASYWRFDARRSGLNEFKSAPMSERDAFKAEMRNIAYRLYPESGPEIFVVFDEECLPIYCATYSDACHEHINDAINIHNIDASKWAVRRMTPDKQITLSRLKGKR